jgi:hypothetical protein
MTEEKFELAKEISLKIEDLKEIKNEMDTRLKGYNEEGDKIYSFDLINRNRDLCEKLLEICNNEIDKEIKNLKKQFDEI